MTGIIHKLWREDSAETDTNNGSWDGAEKDGQGIGAPPSTGPRKNIGIFSATAMASILRLVGTPSMALILWGLGGIISYGGATAFIELGLMYRKNGGTMRFLGACYWLYAAGEDHNTGWNARGVGWGCITFVVKIIVLLIIVITGIVAAAGGIDIEKNDNWSRGFRGTNNDAHGYASALTKVFWAYDGFSNLVYSLGELRKPERNLPWSIGGAVGVVSFLYIMANVAFFFVVPIDVAIHSDEILAAEFSYRVFGSTFGKTVLPVFIGLSVLGAICAQTYGVFGFIPYGRKICGNNKRTGTPIASLVIMYVLTMIYLLAPPPGKVFDLLVDFVQWSTWLFYGLTAVGAIILRFRIPHHPLRTFKSFHPLNGLFILFCAFITVMPFVPPEGGDSGDPYPYYLSPLLGALTTLAGVVPWYFRMFWWADKTEQDYTQWVNDEEEAEKPVPGAEQITHV
ncbi:hypothetical protein DL89DRAFT_266208 [Linderina pennispora]|uniref:Amino acid transporter n=1 Tax=Linderina pennispora TaxID=61395 RepID=A0A1Y1WCU1_9FUNG|nr:uncharacterized protein DL89DRAFT_266208 [Linderina pennispora]ORX71195.1 hypothetical protein DL89DRAFT_266208 [Linderina pennispora]